MYYLCKIVKVSSFDTFLEVVKDLVKVVMAAIVLCTMFSFARRQSLIAADITYNNILFLSDG